MSPPIRSGLCRVFFRGVFSSRVRAGISRKTPSMLIRIPLLSTIPISNPIVKLMNSSESRPATVVSALEVIRMKHWASASVIASSGPRPLSQKPFQVWSSMIA